MSTFRQSRIGWGALTASLPASSNMHLIDIFVNCRPKLPPFGALDPSGSSPIQRTPFCALGHLVLHTSSGCDHSPMTEVRIPLPSQRQVTSNTCHILNMRSPFDIIAYMHSARPTIHIYISITVLLQSHIMLYSHEVTGHSRPPQLGVSRASLLQYTSTLGCRQLIDTVSLPHTNADNSIAHDTDSMSRCNPLPLLYIEGMSHLLLIDEYMGTLVMSYTYSLACFFLSYSLLHAGTGE